MSTPLPSSVVLEPLTTFTPFSELPIEPRLRFGGDVCTLAQWSFVMIVVLLWMFSGLAGNRQETRDKYNFQLLYPTTTLPFGVFINNDG